MDRNRVLDFLPAAVITAAILYLASQPPDSQVVREFPLPAKPGHFAGYFFLAAASYWGLQGRRLLGAPWWKAAPASFLWVLLVAFMDEFVQSFTPGRMDSIFDIFIDAAGAATALLLLLALSLWSKKREAGPHK